MNKNANNRDIKRRLIALLTIAVFVFVMGFCPVSTVVAADTDQPETVESTEAVNGDEVQGDEVLDDETTGDEANPEEGTEEVPAKAEPNLPNKGTGLHDIKEIKERLSIESKKTPAEEKKSEKKSSKLASKYDPRNEAWFKNNVDVLDQGETETCWAQAAATVAQTCYLHELKENGQSITQQYDLSAMGFAYNFYKRQAYPKYGYTGKDKNNPGKRYNYLTNGGNGYLSAQAMAGWMGMHARSSGDYPSTYNDILKLENAVFVPDTYYSYDDIYNLNIDATKEAIDKYGAVMAALYYDDAYIADDDMSYYCDYDQNYDWYYSWGDINHIVSIVGWDDNYSKSNFDAGYELPDIDGAWIVQNSWGTDLHDRGYFYVSYYDWSFQNAVALDMQPANTYDCNYHYDGNATASYRSFKLKSDCANVFTVPNDDKRHTVKAVGLTSWNDTTTEYSVKIYRKVKSTPTTGKLAASFNVTTDNPGCYTFKLSDAGVAPVKLNTGEKFAVVIRALSTGSADKNKMWMGYEKKGSYKWITFASTGKSKTSYYKVAGTKKWKNLYKSNKSASFRIKAFTTTEDRISLSSASVTLPQYSFDYTGKTIKPEPTVVLNGKTLVRNEDYTVSYSKNKYPGTATVKVAGIGLYKGSVSKSFKIAPVNNFRQTVATTSSITLEWDRSPGVSGYKIYRLKSGKFTLIKTISKGSTVKFTEKKLKADKEYQYKIRTFKKVSRKTYNGPISNAIIVRTEAIPEP